MDEVSWGVRGGAIDDLALLPAACMRVQLGPLSCCSRGLLARQAACPVRLPALFHPRAALPPHTNSLLRCSGRPSPTLATTQ